MYRRQTGLAIVFCIGTWLAPAYAQYVTDVPYYHQLFNSINPTGSCQNTTIAITLDYYGADLHPDELSRQYGTEKAKTVSGWEQIFNEQARSLGLTVRDSALGNASLSDVHSRLDRGLPVPVHGAFTASGHLIVLLGYDEVYYYVHDPNGDWSRRYQLDTPTAGRYARYPREAVVRTIESPLNGFVRMHTIHFQSGAIEAHWIEAPPDTVVAGDSERWQARLRVRSEVGPVSIVADLRELGGRIEPLSAIDDSTWQLSSSFGVTAGADHLQLRHGVAVMATDNEAIYADALSSGWREGFTNNVTVGSQSDLVFDGDRALSMDARSLHI